ncbi:MAG TPA: acyl-CoA dehydrogenase family protein [Kribbellaceae bacterium]
MSTTSRPPCRSATSAHCMPAGIDTAALPGEYGGAGLSFRTLGEILRIIGKACPSTACIWLMHLGAALTLVR